MADKSQDPKAPGELSEPTQRTPKGLEIPVPKRRDLMDAFRKIAGVSKKKP